MSLELPKFHETFNPILSVLKDGRVLSTRELINTVIKQYYSDLPTELLAQKTKSGENLLSNRIAWGKSYLKKGGYLVFPERGQVRITEKGINHASNLKIADVVASSTISEIVKLDNQREIIRPRVKNLIKTESPQDLIDTGFNQIEFQVKSELLEKLRSVDPYYFEKVVLILLKKMGYGDFIETPKSADGGVDGVINEDELGLDKIYIQAKRFNENKVREKDIRNFIGAMSGDTNKGVFVTTSSFDDGAIKKANNAHHKIILIDGNKLVELMHKFNVGVQVNSVYEVKGLDEDFFEGQ